MQQFEALYEDGLLRPAKQLPLRPGERVVLIILRRPDAARWDLARLGAPQGEEDALSEAGIAEWVDELDAEDHS
jgi:predicted DNA-binding antitoxin AbrB/MazE fold protein